MQEIAGDWALADRRALWEFADGRGFCGCFKAERAGSFERRFLGCDGWFGAPFRPVVRSVRYFRVLDGFRRSAT